MNTVTTKDFDNFRKFRDYMMDYYNFQVEKPNLVEISKAAELDHELTDDSSAYLVIDPFEESDMAVECFNKVVEYSYIFDYDNDPFKKSDEFIIKFGAMEARNVTGWFHGDDGEYDDFASLPCVKVVVADDIYTYGRYETLLEFETRTGISVEDALLFPEEI